MASRSGRIRHGDRAIDPGDGPRPIWPSGPAPGPGRATSIQEADQALALVLALEVRANGGVPVIGDARWSGELTARFTRELEAAELERDLAWGAFTSGSTGSPRTVVRTAESWQSSHAAVSELIGLRPGDVIYAPAPLVSSLSLFAAVHALSEGADVRLPTRNSFDAADLRDSTILHATPFALGLALDAIESGHPNALRVALIGGDRVTGRLRRRAEAIGVRVVGYYGAAELSFVALDEPDGLRPFPGVETRLRDGVVHVRSPYLSRGYLPGQSGPFEVDEAGWATVGDKAMWSDGGYLELSGRSDSAILTAGATVVPGDVEDAIRGLPAVRDVAVIGIGHPRAGAIVAAILESDSMPASARQLRALAVAELSVAQRPRRWYWTPSLPRTASGKIDRPALAAAVSRGELTRL